MAEPDLSILGEERLVERDGCRIGYRVAGADGPVLLLFSAWQIVHSAAWRAQVQASSGPPSGSTRRSCSASACTTR